MSTHSSDPSVIGETPEQAYGAHRRVESKPEPEHERLLECRARVAKAKARLDAIEDEYRHGLAATLVTYDEVEKSQYDRLYTKKHNGRSFEAVQAGAQAALTRAEAEHDVAWREAEAAGVTDLPLSPIDLGGRSDDEYAASQGSEVRAFKANRFATEKRPRVSRWTKRVAKSGSPADPDTARPRTFRGKRKLPDGSLPDRQDDLSCEPQPERRHARVEQRRKAMKRRRQLQEAQRLRDQVTATQQPKAEENGRWCIIL